jgi:hypothetical protein
MERGRVVIVADPNLIWWPIVATGLLTGVIIAVTVAGYHACSQIKQWLKDRNK